MKRLALALYCTLIAYCNVQAVTLDPASIRERQRFETMTLYVCGTPGFKYPGEIYIENNRTHQIALLYSGDNCGMPTVSADERWIIIADGMRMMGAVHILKREKGITYREVEKDLTKRAADFEIANGLMPVNPDFVKEFFGIESSMEDSHRVLFLDLARKRDDSYFRTGVVYDLESRAFSIPTAEQQARLGREDFGIHRGAVDFHPLVLKPSPTPTAPAKGITLVTTSPAQEESNCAYLAPKSLIAGSFDSYLQAMEAINRGDSDALSLMVTEQLIVIRGEKIPVMVIEKHDTWTEICIPSLAGINHLYVRSSDLTPIMMTPVQRSATPQDVIAQPTPTSKVQKALPVFEDQSEGAVPNDSPMSTPTPFPRVRQSEFSSSPSLAGEQYPQTRLRILTAEDVKGLSIAQLRYAINEVYARYGATFPNTPDIRRQFEKFYWYHPNANLSYEAIDQLMSDVERQNVKCLAQCRELKRGK